MWIVPVHATIGHMAKDSQEKSETYRGQKTRQWCRYGLMHPCPSTSPPLKGLPAGPERTVPCPTLRVGGRWMVRTADLRRELGLRVYREAAG